MKHLILTETTFFRRIRETEHHQAISDIQSEYENFIGCVTGLCCNPSDSTDAYIALSYAEVELQHLGRPIFLPPMNRMPAKPSHSCARCWNMFPNPPARCRHYPPHPLLPPLIHPPIRQSSAGRGRHPTLWKSSTGLTSWAASTTARHH